MRESLMTEERARDVLAQVGRAKKHKASGWDWDRVEVNPHGEACVVCKFNVSTVRMQAWFAGAGANVCRTEKIMGTVYWRVWFDIQPAKQEIRESVQ